jgi:hypothetical protein
MGRESLKNEISRSRSFLNSVNDEEPVQGLSAHVVLHGILREPKLSALDILAVFFRKAEKIEEKMPVPGFIERTGFDENEKLRLIFSAFIDNLAYLYQSFIYMENNDRCHNLFLGIAGMVSPRQKKELNLDHRDEKRFSVLMDAYDFQGGERKKLEAILGNGSGYGLFEKIAVRRMPNFYRIPKQIVKDFADAVSVSGKIAVSPSVFQAIELYDLVPQEKIIEFNSNLDMRKKMEKGEIEEGHYSVQKRNLEAMDMMMFSLMREAEPRVYFRAPYSGLPKLLEARNFVSRLNELVLANCQGISGEIPLDEAKNFLVEYFGSASAPFDESRITRIIKG